MFNMTYDFMVFVLYLSLGSALSKCTQLTDSVFKPNHICMHPLVKFLLLIELLF